MSYFALMLVILLGATSTVAASGSAKPGDLLFPIDRATEEVRLALATPDQKELLQHTFIIERFAELREIVAEEKIATTTSTSSNDVTVRAEGESRVAHAIAILATQLLSETNATRRDQFARDLMTEVSSLRVEGRTNSPLRLDDTRVKINETRAEMRTESERVTIENKDGQVNISYEDRSHDDSDSDSDDDTDDRGRSSGITAPASTISTSTERIKVDRNRSEEDSDDDYGKEESLLRLNTTNTTMSAKDSHGYEREDESRQNDDDDKRHNGSHDEDESDSDDSDDRNNED